MLKRFLIFGAVILCPTLGSAATVRLVNISTNTLTRQLGSIYVGGANISTATVSSATITVATIPTLTATTITVTTITPTGIIGTGTNDSANAGNVGEYLSGYTANVPATSNVAIAISTITLTPGDWDVSANCLTSPDSGTVAFTAIVCYVGATSGNNTTGRNIGDNDCEPSPSNVNNANANITCAIPAVRVSVAGSTPYYLKVRANWSTSTVKLYGRISARRVR